MIGKNGPKLAPPLLGGWAWSAGEIVSTVGDMLAWFVRTLEGSAETYERLERGAAAFGPGETGLLVPPGHPALMAGAVAFLLDSPEAASRMAAAARARLGQRFGEPALRQALTAAYSGDGAAAYPRHG